MKVRSCLILISLLLFSLTSAVDVSEKTYRANQNFCFKIIQKIPRTPHIVFTQGLTFLDKNTLIESSGLVGQSRLQKFDISAKQLTKIVMLERGVFGEGSTIIKDATGQTLIYVLTWTDKQVFVYDEDLSLIRELHIPTKDFSQGWGLTHYYDVDGQPVLLLSDGSNKIFFIEPFEFQVFKTISVLDKFNNSVHKINELEMIKGQLWANVWMEDYVVEIDIDTGQVLNKLDFQELRNQNEWNYYNSNYCLNGIAYNESENLLVLTGKNWPFFYQIQLLDNTQC